MLFSRPIARNIPHLPEIRSLYRASYAKGSRHCPFGVLMAMNWHGAVDFRAYFDDQGRVRGISLCAVSGGMVLVSLVAVCECGQNEQIMAQILNSLECRYQGMSVAVDSGGVMSLSPDGHAESLVAVLRGAGYTEVGLLSLNGRAEYPIVAKGRMMTDAAAKVALRGMPSSVIPSLVRA